MTTYNGYLVTPYASNRRGGDLCSGMLHYRSRIVTNIYHSGTSSLEILPGGSHDIFYGCDAGEKTITVWVYPPVGAGVGKCALEVFPLGANTEDCIARALSTGTDAWEQLSVTFTALKAVYKVRLINRVRPQGDTRAYFDDLE